MKWQRGYQSEDVEDRRGESGGGGFRGGGFGGMRLGLGGFLVLLVLSFVFKKDFFALLDPGGAPSASVNQSPAPRPPANDEASSMISSVLDDAQETWTSTIRGYRKARLVLFTDAISSACGFAEAATGPFYCPADEKVYLDLGFFDELRRRFGAPGDFAQAYVVAHEVGHHVQKVIGVESKMRAAQERNPAAANDLSVRMELQADCFAGVWAKRAGSRVQLEAGDAEEALKAAAAIGDDRLQRMAGRRVSPESFTHGSSEQRVRWFRTGFESGTPNACDTFGARGI